MSARIICVAQQKGGAGKTTLVSNLAIAYLAAGKSVGLLDTDPQGSLGKWLDIREEMLGLNPKLRFATATPYGISRAIRTVGNEADVILIDTPPKADSDVRWVLRIWCWCRYRPVRPMFGRPMTYWIWPSGRRNRRIS